jgi:hypothetical protein
MFSILMLICLMKIKRHLNNISIGRNDCSHAEIIQVQGGPLSSTLINDRVKHWLA